MNIFHTLEQTFGNYYFLLSIMSVSSLIKWYLFKQTLTQNIRFKQTKISWISLLIVLAGSGFTDFSWIPTLISSLKIINIPYQYTLFIVRIAWGCSIIQYQALSIFIESLSKKNYSIPIQQKLFFMFSALLAILFFGFAFFDISCDASDKRSAIELFLRDYIIPSYNLFLPVMSIIILIFRMKTKDFPQILHRQFTLFLQLLSIPIISDFLQIFPFVSRSFDWVANSFAVVGLSASILTIALYYYSKKISELRFLNVNDNVSQHLTNPLLEDFRSTLELLGAVTNAKELKHITASFFKGTFYIPIQKTFLSIRQTNHSQTNNTYEIHSTESLTEAFISTNTELFETFIAQHRILMYDEIEFSNFYHENEISKQIAYFLDTINADIFIPIYHNSHYIAYIIIEKHARPKKLYTQFEQDQMILYATYLGNIIHLLQHKKYEQNNVLKQNVNRLLNQQKHELNLYQESIKKYYGRTAVGIICYRHRTFIYGNKQAHTLLGIDLNNQQGHPITKALLDISRKAEKFKTEHTIQIYNENKEHLLLTAAPHLENAGVIITICYPDVADIIKPYLSTLKDQDEWNYLLYLQITQSGQLLQSLLPGNTHTILQKNIEILKKILKSTSFAVNAKTDDILPITNIIHQIHKRKTMQTIDCKLHKSNEIAMQIFGVNPLFNATKKYQHPLIETLHRNGTLVIDNMHLLALDVQSQLADYIQTGTYHSFKGERTYQSNVLIICTTDKQLSQLLEEEKLHPHLHAALRKNIISLPKLSLIPEKELYECIDAITKQSICEPALINIIQLSHAEKERIKRKLPESITVFKAMIEKIVATKVEKTLHNQPDIDEPQHPTLVYAAKLGKKALKDEGLMKELVKLVGNKKKLAELLGVNRSSIYRHYKDE